MVSSQLKAYTLPTNGTYVTGELDRKASLWLSTNNRFQHR